MRKLIFSALLVVCSGAGQPRDRVLGPIKTETRTRLRGNLQPLARVEFDTGRAKPDVRMERMTLVLLPDDQQQQALDSWMADGPPAEGWLTPEEFGARFGVSENDLARVVNWLEDSGFTVEPAPAGRRWLVFSGTVAQVEAAFHTEMHTYRVNGVAHHANATTPEIPEALSPVVGGVAALHDFESAPQHVPADAVSPEFSGGTLHDLGPADFAAIYDVGPLYTSGINGAGQSIAVVGRSNIVPQDIATYRSLFGLPAANPTVIVNGPDPGVLSKNEQTEAELDVELAGAVARNATVELVVSASTSSTDGIVLSAQYIVNHNLAPVVTMSFGSCEAALGAAGNQFWNALWQQAAAQGMTVVVSSGDSGAAGCDTASLNSSSGPQAVNGLCSSPYSTCVGGTQFSDAANPTSYWSATNIPGTYQSALGYIPEVAWNESGMAAGGSGLWASGGGASSVYAKPSWQTGSGMPAGAFRYVPDVALASAAHEGFLLIVNGGAAVAGGTSAATPSFAGLMALTAQRRGTPLGNVNPVLYTLAALQARGGAAAFHDVTSGNNSVPGLPGYNAGAGYDPVTGLGSVDANLLVNNWNAGMTSVGPTPPDEKQPASCSYTVTPGPVKRTTLGYPVMATVSAGTGCSWTASSNTSWITVESAAGIGTATVNYWVAPNTGSGTRSGSLVVAGTTVTVTEAGRGLTVSIGAPTR